MLPIRPRPEAGQMTAHRMQHGVDGFAPGNQVVDVEQRAQRRTDRDHRSVEEAVAKAVPAAVDGVRQHLPGQARPG